MKTPAQRKAAERARYKAQGLRPLTLYVKPEHRAAIRAYADILEGKKPEPRGVMGGGEKRGPGKCRE